MTSIPLRATLVAVALLAPTTALLAQAPLAQTAGADAWAQLALPRTHVPTPTTTAITAADLMTRLYIFADDSMSGRLIGTKGNAQGVEYIASELGKLGLKPAGDNGTFFQTVPLVTRAFDPASSISAGGTALQPWTDYVPRDPGARLKPVNGTQVVFAGDWSDTTHRLSPAAAAGKFIVLMSSTNYPQNPPGIPNRQEVAAYYASAAAIAVIGADAFPPATLAQYRTAVNPPGPPQANPVGAPAYLYITKHAAEVLLGAPDGLKAGAMGKTISGELRYAETPIQMAYPARNVVAIIPGSDPKLRGEYVAIGAHNDHIGLTSSGMNDVTRPVAHDSIYVVDHLFREGGADDPPPQLNATQQKQVNDILAGIRRKNGGASARVDSVFNGADDDGSGSVSVLEIAQYFAGQAVKPKRSLLFVWHVGEEEGLYGSQYFTDHPTVPRDSIVAQLNIDMIGRGDASDVTGVKKGGQEQIHGSTNYLQLVGSRRLSTELGNLAETVNTSGKHNLTFDYSLDANQHEAQIYCRSDHYEYARYGIPIIFFTTGGHADYHQVTDEPQYIDYGHMARVATFIADMAQHVGDLDHRPVVDKPKPDPFGACIQ